MRKKTDEPYHYVTHDLNVAAVIITLGHDLDHLEKSDEGRAQFHFVTSPTIVDIVRKYWRQELKINPHRLWENWKFLKSRIHGDV